jgi:hypothetical protein
MAASVSKPKSAEENEHKELTDETIAKFSLAFASIQSDENGNRTVSPAKLTPAFQDIIRKTKIDSATHKMQVLMRVHTSTERDAGDRYTFNNTLHFQVFDKPFVAALRSARTLDESFNVAATPPTTKLSVLSFLTPCLDSPAFRDRVYRDLTAQGQEAVGIEKSLVEKRDSDIYIGGLLSKPDDVASLLANLFTFWKCLISDVEDSMFWKALKQLYDLLSTDGGRRWRQRYSTPNVTANLVSEIQDVWNLFFGIANKFELYNAVSKALPVDPSPWDVALANVTDIHNRLQSSIGVMSDKHYESPAVLYTLLHDQSQNKHKKSTVTNLGKDPSTKQPRQYDSGTDAKKAKYDDSNDKSKGFLTFPPNRRLPVPSVFLPSRNNRDERLCMSWATRNHACRYRNHCKFAHPTSFSRLPPEKQKELIDFVEKNPDLQFVEGLGPSGKH